MKKVSMLLPFLVLLVGCNDNSIVTVYDKSIKEQDINCLRLSSLTMDKNISSYIKKYYNFTDECLYSLNISYKSSIVCNSPYNASQKNLSSFPNSYLNMEIRKGFNLEYSYYIDLQHKPTMDDIKKGWDRIVKDLDIKHK